MTTFWRRCPPGAITCVTVSPPRAHRAMRCVTSALWMRRGQWSPACARSAQSEPLAHGTGPENIFVLHTERYQRHPLVIAGPGAGVAVTAGAVIGDILRTAGALDEATPVEARVCHPSTRARHRRRPRHRPPLAADRRSCPSAARRRSCRPSQDSCCRAPECTVPPIFSSKRILRVGR